MSPRVWIPLIATLLAGAVRSQPGTPARPSMPAYPSPFHAASLEGLEAHPDHPGGRADPEGRIRFKALSGIARFQLELAPGERPVAMEIRVDGWGDALEGLDLTRPDGEHRSLLEGGDSTISFKDGSLFVTLGPATLAWLATGTKLQFIDRYR